MAVDWGSSPLARGLRLAFGRSLPSSRIIPARAGFTPEPGPDDRGGTDHPRSRGVYEPWPSQSATPAGSSPLARGLLGDSLSDLLDVGIIPARAGFTVRSQCVLRVGWDHPRSRGVYCSGPQPFLRGQGSSPLARGLLNLSDRLDSNLRIIPARAGFTFPGAQSLGTQRDHPRSRGVYRT